MSRAVSIRSQLKKYMQRFGLPLDSCEGDAKRLRKCLVTGYWRNVARWMADGTYRAVRGDTVRFQLNHVIYTLTISPGAACPSPFRVVYKKTTQWLGRLPRNGGDKEDTVGVLCICGAATDLRF